MAIDFSDVAKPIDEKQLPNQVQAGLVDFSDVAKPIGTNESRNAYQWSPANGTIFDQIDQQKLMYDPNLPDATIGRVFMAGVKDAFEGYAGGSAMEAAESRNIMGMTPEQIKAHLGEGARNSLMGDYALTKMENIDNNYIKNKEGIKAGIRDGIVDKATALAKMADPGDYNLPTSFLGQLGHDILRSTPYSMMSAVPSIATGALTGGAALPTLIVSFLTSMGEASSEGGRTYMSMIEAGKSHDEAYAAASKNKDFNTLMLTLSNMISGQLFGSVPRGIDEVNLAKLKGTPLSELSRAGQVMGKAMERPIISNIAKSPVKRGLVSLGSEFVMEGSEEMGQSVSDAVVRGEKINVPNLLYEGLVGGLSGAGQSSVGTAIDYAKNRGARAKYQKLAELMEIMKEKDTPEGGNNKVVAEAISKFKGNEHNVMFDSLNERNRILALPLEDRSALEEQALPVLSEAVNLFTQGKVDEGLSLLAEKDVNFDFEEAQTFPTKPQGPVKDVSMHSNETIGAIGEGPQLQEMARAEFNRLRSIPANQRTAKDNQALQAYRRVMEGYTAGNNLAGDLGFVAQRTVTGQPITANEPAQQDAPIPGRSFNNAQLAPIGEMSPLDRTYVGEPRPVSGGVIINKPDGNAVFVPQAEMGGYYQVDNEQSQTQMPITPQPPATQPVQRAKKQQKPAPVPQVRDGVGTNDVYQGGDGVAYWVRGFDANNKLVMADNTGSILRVTPEQLAQNFQRLSPARREQVSLSAPVRSEIPSLADKQKAAEKEQAAQLATIDEGSPMDRTFVGEPKPVNGGFVVNKPNGTAVFVPQSQIGNYYRVDNNRQRTTQTTPQTQMQTQTQPKTIQSAKVQGNKKQSVIPESRNGVAPSDVYQAKDGVAYWVQGFDTKNNVVMNDDTGSIVRIAPERLGQDFQRLSPVREEKVPMTGPTRTASRQPYSPPATTGNEVPQGQGLAVAKPQPINGIVVNDVYQDAQGTAFHVTNVTNDRVTIADARGQAITVKPTTLSSERYTRLSPEYKRNVPLSSPMRTDAPSLIERQKEAERQLASQKTKQTTFQQKQNAGQQATQSTQAIQEQATQPSMARTPEVAKAVAKAKTEKQAKPTTEKTNTSTPAQTTTEQEQMARGQTAKTPSESTTTNEVKKEDKVPKGTKETRESTPKVGEKYKNKTGQTVIVKSVEDGNVSFDLETPGIMKPSPRSIEKFTESYKKIDDDTKYKVEPETEERTKRTVTAKDISSAVKGAKVRETKDGIISIQFKNGFVLNVDPNSDEIVINPEIVKRDYGRDPNSGDKIIGSATMVGNEGFIRLISGMADLKTFNHELYHIAEKMVLTKEQIAIVERAYGGSEERANAFADVAFKRKQAKNKLVTSLFQKISDFFSDIRAKLFGQNSGDIFRQIGDGKVAMGSNAMNNEAYRIADKLKALDKQYMDAVENGDIETAQRLVYEAAQEAGLPLLDNDERLSYAYRRGPEPKKTFKAYKLFKMKDGKLYPMFIGADSPIETGMWLDAKGNDFYLLDDRGRKRVPALTGSWTVMADGKKMRTLAFRPGWHSGGLPHAIQIAPKNEQGAKSRYEDDVWAEIEVMSDIDYTDEAMANASVTKAGTKNAREAQLTRVPENGFYPYKTNSNAEGTWYISGAIKINDILTQEQVNAILEENGITPMPWIGGEQNLDKFGIVPGSQESISKLTDPVTYDDNGDVIPLSERFNPQIADPRYRIVGMGGQKFSSPAEVTMVTPADKQVAKQKVANLQYVPAPQTTWKTDSGRNKKDQAAWHALTDGLESVVEKREPRMTLKERIVHVKDWIVDNWIDNLSIIQRTADEKLYRHARGKVDGISSRAEKLIKFGDKKRGVEGLTQIFKGMSDEEFKGFLHYAEYKNIIDIINNSEEAMRFISKAYDEIASEKARLKELRSTKPLDADDAKQLARGIRGTVRYIEQLQKDIDHSLEYVREVRGKADQYLTTVMKMEKLYPDWVERQQKLTKYTNNLLRINRDSGMISANLYRFLTETRPNYIPALRDFSDEEGKVGLDSFIETRGFVNLKSPLRRMHGSKRDIVNPIDEIIANTFRTMSLEAKQSVATSFIDFYESRKDGDEYLWRTKPDKAIEEGHFMFFVRRDGEKHYYATDSPALYEALTLRSTSKINLGSVGKPAELITKILRQATTRAVRFIVRNPERDNFQAAIYGEGFIPFVTAFRGGIQVVGGGEWFERFLEAGGAQGISTVDSDRLADMKAEILGKKFFRSKNPLKNIWNLLGRMAEITELSTRVGQFKKAIELGYTDEEAAYIARDLMNFGIGGSDAKQMNRYIPFLTASIQDMNRFYRGHSKKNIAKTVRRAMMYITIPTLALWFWNNGDDDRKEYWDKLATWEKNAFWWIILNKDTAIPVAKPFLLGLVYGSLPERFMDYWLNNDRRAVEDFGKTLLAQTMPGYMPLALQLVMEWVLNKSFFYGREIVPANEQKLEGKLQYGPYTSEWAKAMGNITGISPRKLEYTVFGVTGSLGKETSAVVDDIWRFASGTSRPDKYITEYIPGSTAWISHGRNHMGPLYAWNLAFPALEEAYRSAKKVYEVDGADALSDRQRLLLTYEDDVKAILKLNTHKEGIWKLQSLKNKVVVDKAMTAEQKRKAVDAINARIILLSQVGLKKLDFFQDAIDSMEDKMDARR